LILFFLSLDHGVAVVGKFSRGAKMARQASDTGAPVAVVKAYDFVLWLLPKVESFPRKHKFTVGERLAANGLDLMMALVEAAYSRDKEELLERANRKVNSTRYLLRLAKDLQLMSVDAYGFSAERLDEIGRMVGGWKRTAPKRILATDERG
jgi:hypothetical protein